MTLVRKGKISSNTYHVIYAFSLWFLYVAAYIYGLGSEGNKIAWFTPELLHVLWIGTVGYLCYFMRCKWRYSVNQVWCTGVLLICSIRAEYFTCAGMAFLDSTLVATLAAWHQTLMVAFVSLHITAAYCLLDIGFSYAPLLVTSKVKEEPRIAKSEDSLTNANQSLKLQDISPSNTSRSHTQSAG